MKVTDETAHRQWLAEMHRRADAKLGGRTGDPSAHGHGKRRGPYVVTSRIASAPTVRVFYVRTSIGVEWTSRLEDARTYPTLAAADKSDGVAAGGDVVPKGSVSPNGCS